MDIDGEGREKPGGGQYGVIMEDGGVPLDCYLEKHALSYVERVRLAVGLSEAVEELHRLELVHRDLKPSNVLVDAWMGVRLCDLDEVRDGIVTTMHSHTVRSPMYTCPSVGEAGGYGSSGDVYSLSLMVGEILVGLPVLRLYAEAVGRVRRRAGVNEWSARSEGFCAMGGAVGEERVEVRVRPPVEECMSVGADVKAGLGRWWSPYEREAGVGYCGGDVAAVLRGELERVDASGGAGVGPPSPPPVPVVPSVPPPVAKARHLYVIGGRDGKWELLDRVERYDLVSGEWETLSGMGEGRLFSGAAVVRGRICVAGGDGGSHISEQLHDVRRHGGHVECPARDEQGALFSWTGECR